MYYWNRLTHVSGEFFLFKGLEEYTLFTDRYPDLGILIEISHNCFDGYTEDDIIKFLGDKNVKALHVSDALQNVDIGKGAHLPVGEGSVDFNKLLKYFDKVPGIFAVLEIKADNQKILNSLNQLKNMLT